MTIDEAFSETGYFFENLLKDHNELTLEFRAALEGGHKPYMWQQLNNLIGNTLIIRVTPTSELTGDPTAT